MANDIGLTLEKPIQELISLFDKKLNELGQSSLLDNNSFEIDKDLQFNHYLRFSYTKRQPSEIDLSFEVSNSGVIFHIDNTSEVPEWSYQAILNDPESFQETIENIFTCYVMVERKGRRTTVCLFNKEGNQKMVFAYFYGIGLSFLAKSERKLYKPIF